MSQELPGGLQKWSRIELECLCGAGGMAVTMAVAGAGVASLTQCGLSLGCYDCPRLALPRGRSRRSWKRVRVMSTARSQEEQEEGKPESRWHAGGARSSGPNLTSLLSVAPLVYPLIAEEGGYSQASYYTSLGLFLFSLPGLWSLIKRSAKSKVVKKTFNVPGPAAESGKAPSQIAGEITSFFTRNNFVITDRGETVVFEGNMVPSRGQAAFLTFCTAVSLASVALVLSITVPDVGEKWYSVIALSPLAGAYYWTRASRKEQIKVKMLIADDETSTDVIVQGDDEQVDQLRKELALMEKGMVYVKGLLERS